MSSLPFYRIPEFPLALQVGQWTILLQNLPRISADSAFKANDVVCIREVHPARAHMSYVSRTNSNIHNTDYIISKFGKRQIETKIQSPSSFRQYCYNKNMSLTLNGRYETAELRPGLKVYLTDDFTFNIRGTQYLVKKGTRVTIAEGPRTVQTGSRSTNPLEWGYQIDYSMFELVDAVVYYPLAVRADFCSPNATQRPVGRAGSLQ